VGHDYLGGDLGTPLVVTSLFGCCTQCGITVGCIGYTFRGPDSCQLKNNISIPVVDPQVISGIGYCLFPQNDFYGVFSSKLDFSEKILIYFSLGCFNRWFNNKFNLH
jgi:hypothetical protein